jgi:hypothetical protein
MGDIDFWLNDIGYLLKTKIILSIWNNFLCLCWAGVLKLFTRAINSLIIWGVTLEWNPLSCLAYTY